MKLKNSKNTVLKSGMVMYVQFFSCMYYFYCIKPEDFARVIITVIVK